jgi:hypothetical protein
MRTAAELSEGARVGLAAKRVFFGHQSVGTDIMDGVRDLVRDGKARGLRVLTVDGATTAGGGFFADALVGRNEHPETKTDGFAALLRERLGPRLDIAFHKYCFVDAGPETDLASVFGHYRDTMAGLKASFPAVTFVHVTMPLMTAQSGPRAGIKSIFGRAPAGYEANLRRETFNEMMRREYSGREPVFDLAALESTEPGGQAVTTSFRGVTAPALFEGYTTDGGHLNAAGRRRIAETLLVFLSGLE